MKHVDSSLTGVDKENLQKAAQPEKKEAPKKQPLKPVVASQPAPSKGVDASLFTKAPEAVKVESGAESDEASVVQP